MQFFPKLSMEFILSFKVFFQKTSLEVQYTDIQKSKYYFVSWCFQRKEWNIPIYLNPITWFSISKILFWRKFYIVGYFYILYSATVSFQTVQLRICFFSLFTCIYLLKFGLRYFSCTYLCFDYQVGAFKSTSPRSFETSWTARFDLDKEHFLISPLLTYLLKLL